LNAPAQLFAVVEFTHSHPFAHLPSLLLKPGEQTAIVQLLATHEVAATLPTHVVLQLRPHIPQLVLLVEVSVSQPSA
jgi:hypothetical protein